MPRGIRTQSPRHPARQAPHRAARRGHRRPQGGRQDRDRNPARRGYAERQAINAPLQGGAADIIKRAMVRLPGALKREGFKARLLLQVHDELLFEAPEDEAERLATVARDVMQSAAELSVPLMVETGFGRNWAEAH